MGIPPSARADPDGRRVRFAAALGPGQELVLHTKAAHRALSEAQLRDEHLGAPGNSGTLLSKTWRNCLRVEVRDRAS